MEKLQNNKVAIIGAGLAGLTSAYLLRKQYEFLDIEIFEASDLVGGRVRTLRDFDDDLYAEAGGMIFTDCEKEILSLIDEMGLELLPRADKLTSRFFISGAWDSGESVQKIMTIMAEEIAQIRLEIKEDIDWAEKESALLDELDAISIVDFIKRKDSQLSNVTAILSATLLGVYADDLNQLSALDAMRFMAQYIDCRQMYSIKGGNDLLTTTLSDWLASSQVRISLNSAVSKVQKSEESWKISFKNKQKEPGVFDYVIMATPLSTLQLEHREGIELPGLPQSRINMVNDIAYNRSITRAYCQVRERFWQAECQHTNVITDYATCWLEDHSAVDPESKSAIVEVHMGGELILEASLQDAVMIGKQRVSDIYGSQFNQHLQPEKTQVIAWREVPYQFGNYPYFSMNQRHYWSALREPLGNSLFFAGEYTATSSPISMNGAVRSAHRVVYEELSPIIAEKFIGMMEFE